MWDLRSQASVWGLPNSLMQHWGESLPLGPLISLSLQWGPYSACRVIEGCFVVEKPCVNPAAFTWKLAISRLMTGTPLLNA